MTSRRDLIFFSLAALAASSIAITSCFAIETGERQINVTTYLRGGPGDAFRVIDEVQNGTRVHLESCGKGWCRIYYEGASGYVAQTTMTQPYEMVPTLNHETCFTNREAGYHGGRDDILCRALPPKNVPAITAAPSK